MRTGHFDPETGKWVDDAPPHEFPDLPSERVVVEGPDGLVRPAKQDPGPDDFAPPTAASRATDATRSRLAADDPGGTIYLDAPPSLADKARAAKAFVLNKYTPPPGQAGPVTQESMDWAQRPDVQRANAASRLEGGTGTYEDRQAVGLPVPQSQDSADAEGFARFAGMGAAGELAVPLAGRAFSSLAERARMINAGRAARLGPVDPGVMAPVETGPSLAGGIPGFLRDPGPELWRGYEGGPGQPVPDQFAEPTPVPGREVRMEEPTKPGAFTRDRGYEDIPPEERE